jgi:hypothetical protein
MSTETKTKKGPTRKELLSICERAFVPQTKWTDRDSSAAQRQLGECYALLKAGCRFTVSTERDTHWVTVIFHGFGHFDWDGADDDERYYLPTEERLLRRDGQDWY